MIHIVLFLMFVLGLCIWLLNGENALNNPKISMAGICLSLIATIILVGMFVLTMIGVLPNH